jgi:hypothetical protein
MGSWFRINNNHDLRDISVGLEHIGLAMHYLAS